jgi:hypothetical protein
VLSDHGVTSWTEFNRRLEAATRAHRLHFGHDPSPGFAFDLVRIPLADHEYDSLLRHFVRPPKLGSSQIGAALGFGGTLDGLAGGPDRAGGPGPGGMSLVDPPDWDPKALIPFRPAGPDQMTPEMRRRMMRRERAARMGLLDVDEWGDRFLGDAAAFIAGIPFGVYETGKAVGFDVRDIATGRDYTPTRSLDLAKQIGVQIVHDFTHAREHPFFAIADIFMLATAGVGAGARVGAAAGRVAAGAGPRAVVSALVHKPPPRSYILGTEAMNATIPLFDNALLNLITAPYRVGRQTALVKRIEGQVSYERVPAGAAGRAVMRYLSTEAKLRRARHQDDLMKHGLMSIPVEQFARMTRARAAARIVRDAAKDTDLSTWNRLPRRAQAIIDEAIFLEHLPVDDPVPVARAALNREIRNLEDRIVDLDDEVRLTPAEKEGLAKTLNEGIAHHRAELDLIDDVVELAKSEKASPAMRAVIDKAREVSDWQAVVKKQLLGWDDEMLIRHLLEEGAMFLGLDVVPGTGTHLVKVGDFDAQLVPERLPGEAIITGQEGRVSLFGSRPFYLPYRTELMFTRNGGMGERGRGAYGLSPPQEPAAWNHRWTGDSFKSGRRSLDTSELLAREARLVAKMAVQRDQWESIWAVGRETPGGIPAAFLGVVRDIAAAPPSLKKALGTIEKAKVSRKEAQALDDATYDKALEWMYPDRKDIAPDESVRYVDRRNIPEMAGVLSAAEWRTIDRAAQNVMGILNEPGRVVYLFARVAYAINFLGSAALGLMHTVFAPKNMMRVWRSEQHYGTYVAQMLRELAGSSRSLSFATEKTLATKTSQGMAKLWSKVTDDKWREGAVLHELYRQGILTKDGIGPAELERLVKAGDEATLRKLTIARHNGRKSMVDFDNMTWPEKAVMRHLFFIYGWVSRSAVWSLRTMGEHPIKVTVAAQAGADYEEAVERMLGKVPEWFTREGWIPINRSFALNPLQFNTLSTLVDLGYPLASLFKGKLRYTDVSDILGPSASFFTDVFGASQPGDEDQGRIWGALTEELTQTPFGAIAARGEEQPADPTIAVVPPKGIGPGNLLDWATRPEVGQGGFVEQRTFETDGFINQFGPWFFGSLYRDPNEAAAQAKAWRDLREDDPAAFVDHQVQVALERLRAQEKYMGQAAPDSVRASIGLLGDIEKAEIAVAEQEGIEGQLGQRDKFEVTVEVLRQRGYLTPAEAKAYMEQAENAPVSEVLELRMKILLDEGKLLAVRDWIQNLRDLQWYATPLYKQALDTVKTEGLGTFANARDATVDERLAYGRKVLPYLEERAAIMERFEADDKARVAALNQLELRWDKTVKIGGKEFPSAVSIEWARLDAEHRQRERIQAAHAEWEDVSPFMRRMLGRPADATTIAGWAELNAIRTAFYARERYGMRARDVVKVARELDKDRRFRGIYQDALYAFQPGYRRFELTTVYQRSQNRGKWDDILELAKTFNEMRNSGRWTKGHVDDTWKTVLNERILPWAREEVGGVFWSEVDGMGITWLKDMIK